MSWTAPKTWINDEPLTAADLNAQVSNNVDYLSQLLNSYTLLRDEKTGGVNGGTFTAGGWRTRDINVKIGDAMGNVTLGSNQFTLAAGTYFLHASAPAAAVDRHKINLYNLTDNYAFRVGDNAYASSVYDAQTNARLSTFLTITAPKVIELQHYAQTTCATYGFGRTVAYGTEVYTSIEIWRLK